MKRAILLALVIVVTLGFAFALAAEIADAKIGVAHGIGPHAPHPLTPHIGPVYWQPGDRATRAAAAKASGGPTELDQFIQGLHKDPTKLRCDRQRLEYIGRHGVTTPTPLKGFHGCAKYALDAAYWRHRRNEPSLLMPNLGRAIQQSFVLRFHDTLIGW